MAPLEPEEFLNVLGPVRVHPFLEIPFRRWIREQEGRQSTAVQPGFEAIDAEGVILRFGADDDLATKLSLIEPIRRSTANAKKLRAIDLRAPDTPVVEFP